VQNDEYDSDDDQKVNPTAELRESWTDISTEKAEQPQDYQNHDDSPQHRISPSNDLSEATWSSDQVAVDL
jgi:hypothetical protein